MKKHWIRKRLSRNPLLRDDGKIGRTVYYDATSACGRFAILSGTIFRNKVTCKTCLRIMKKSAR